MPESNLVICRSVQSVSFLLFTSLSVHLSHPSLHLSLHAVSRRALLEVRSESTSVCRQPWQPCPNWPMAWQDDCQLLSIRAVHADRRPQMGPSDTRRVWTRGRVYSFYTPPSLGINFVRIILLVIFGDEKMISLLFGVFVLQCVFAYFWSYSVDLSVSIGLFFL